MPMNPPRKCADPNCHRLTHYRYCREHRTIPTRLSSRNRLCMTLSELAGLCKHLSSKGVETRAELTESGVAIHFDNKIEKPRREDIGFRKLLAIKSANETTELVQSILRSFAREAQKKEKKNARSATAA